MTVGLLKSASVIALLAAAGLMVGSAAPTAARAADLGGDCCADLEERVAELEATTVRKGNKKVSLTITGRVSATMTYWNDGFGLNGGGNDHNSDVYFGDASGLYPRIDFKGEGKISSDLVAGYSLRLRGDFDGKNSQTTHQEGNLATANKTYVYLDSKSLGRLTLGYLDGAADDAAALNVNPAAMGGLNNAGNANKNFFLRTAAGTTAGTTYGKLLSTLEPARENALQYTTPKLGKWLTVEAEAGGDDTAQIGALLDGKIGETITVKAGLGYQTSTGPDGVLGGTQGNANAATTANRLFTSAGVSDSISGLFVQGYYNVRYNQGNVANHLQDITFWKVDAGWSKNINALGNTTLWASYLQNNNVLEDGSKGTVTQIGIDQALDDAAANVYLTYEAATVDGMTPKTAGISAFGSQTLSSVTGGMTIKF